MLLPWEIKCNITRAPMRSILIACVSALMVCGMALYLRNIQVTEEALDDLARQVPVTVRVTNRDGYLHDGLRIQARDVDYLLESGVRDPVYTATEFIAEPVGSIYGTNTLDSLDGLSGPDFTFIDGWDESFPMSGKPVIALREDIASKNGWQLGDKFRLEFSLPDVDAGTIMKAGGCSVTLIATYPRERDTVKAVIPADWLRNAAGLSLPDNMFRYSSFSAVLEEPRELNAYKDELERRGFLERSAVADPGIEGDALSMDDEMYIKTSGELRESLELYLTFLAPFFGLVTSVMALVTFLSLRSCRRQIAITSSLGRPKFLNAAAHFCSTMIVQLAGCLPAMLTLSLALDLRPWQAGTAIGAFSLCAAGGTALALWFLFRFDTLALLTKEE